MLFFLKKKIIFRLELCMLLENEHIFEPETSNESFSFSHPLTYEKVTSFLFNQRIYWVS